MTLEIQIFLLCFFAGMLFSLAVAILVGRLYHAPSSMTSQTRLNRRLLQVWAPATVSCSAGTYIILIWRKSSPLLHPDLGKAVSNSTGNLVLVLAVLVISSACVSAVVLPILSFFGHLFNTSLSWAHVANDWANYMVESLDLESAPIFRPTWEIWTFATNVLAFFLGPWYKGPRGERSRLLGTRCEGVLEGGSVWTSTKQLNQDVVDFTYTLKDLPSMKFTCWLVCCITALVYSVLYRNMRVNQ
ncbi:BQ5605_C012g06826 [Microbotryum silenes-dioicae]|uniref:BQ5605_C012g06826 protein n=1 Tax=Microbotryum silenes-dioicae TaxID=796604 RepID=A0A2X0NPM9_9BASI|nr:BQ5605_C012g06826 [Microbotryum silenes-dioicae]